MFLHLVVLFQSSVMQMSPFFFDIKKQVETVFLVFTSTPQSIAHVHMWSRMSCIRTDAVVMVSTECMAARSSAWSALEMRVGTFCIMSLIKKRNRVVEMTDPCGTPSQSLTI